MRRPPQIWLALAVFTACDAAPEPNPVIASSPADIGVASVMTDDDCRACHPSASESWSQSRHHRSFSNPDFQRSYTREPKAFCRNCHAPALTRSVALPGSEAEALGVGCLDCHGGPDGVRTGPGQLRDAPHAIVVEPDFGTRSCEGCHEFEFPSDSRRPPGTMMQTTVREHAASGFADVACATCHLPRDPDQPARVDHSLASTRNDDAIRNALEVRAERDGNALHLELRPRGVGHAFPTGDLFRRLEIHADLRVDDRVVAEATRWLGRHFAPFRRRDGTRNPAYDWPVPDDRVVGPTEVVVPLDAGVAGAQLHWRLDYQRVDARDDLDPGASEIADEVRLAAGVL